MILAGAGNTAVEVMRFKPPVFVPPHELWAHLNEKKKKICDVSESEKEKKKDKKNASLFGVVSAIHGHEQGQGAATERRAAAAGCCCVKPEATELLLVM